ncbi:aminoacyl-tRNA hydrolase [Mumia zhuanghuii]|uniref:Alternative ribosome rescue aminoacyl-tRNA hydrolase ArfB n=2 Tax=Mumia TaxID=1546255 RepID=A0ABW1QKQ2_9ACTN|nr:MULTISPECIES: alternative ribosome rescue aminoacyl-tRNA hydrolase ArfB [Mumia]KAA1424884.1 aminoacyl-tRNA hydrolase [Mumia zhuanghuii]
MSPAATGPLVVPPGPGIPRGLVVPEHEIDERFSRSPGPGGQSVNTTDSRVEIVFDVAASETLTPQQRDRVLAAVGPRISVTASEHRSQLRNRVAARERLAERLRTALAPPPRPRVATKPTRGSQRRRVEAKRRRSVTKSHRGRVRDE